MANTSFFMVACIGLLYAICQRPKTDSVKAQIASIVFCDELTAVGRGWVLYNLLSSR